MSIERLNSIYNCPFVIVSGRNGTTDNRLQQQQQQQSKTAKASRILFKTEHYNPRTKNAAQRHTMASVCVCGWSQSIGHTQRDCWTIGRASICSKRGTQNWLIVNDFSLLQQATHPFINIVFCIYLIVIISACSFAVGHFLLLCFYVSKWPSSFFHFFPTVSCSTLSLQMSIGGFVLFISFLVVSLLIKLYALINCAN